jgi:hypothetical protein
MVGLRRRRGVMGDDADDPEDEVDDKDNDDEDEAAPSSRSVLLVVETPFPTTNCSELVHLRGR